MTAALLDAIAEAPNDDGPRLVYADWLQQQPDDISQARGEYISLACSTARNPKRTLRMKELFDRHAAAWLGPVATVTDPVRRLWARGFLDGCALVREAPPMTADAALGHPAWRTLRVLETPSSTLSPWEIPRIICQPATINLKALYTLQSQIDDIVQSAHAPRLLELAVAPSGRPLTYLFPLLAADCFMRLRRLHLFGCAPALLTQLARPGLTLVVVARPTSLRSWIEELDRERALLQEVRLVSSVFPLLERRGIELLVKPDADHHWNRLEVRWTEDNEPKLRDQVIHNLGLLPDGTIQRLSFVGPPAAQFDVDRWKQRVASALPGAAVES